MAFWKDFKAFAMRGNMVDMAVGVIVGGAFGKIVSSLVSDIIMPPIGMLVGNVHFSELAFTLKAATADAPAVVVAYGQFIQTVVDFLIIALTIFLVIRNLSKLQRKRDEEPVAPPAPTKDQELLTEIRDLLKEKK